MALNNSGPISFGGSTVGQSINLELGVSATALASINSSAFRTLAGVSSGQISLSNFYGKSSKQPSFFSQPAGNYAGAIYKTVLAASGNVYTFQKMTLSGLYAITKLNASGVVQWTKTLGFTSFPLSTDPYYTGVNVAEDSSGNVYWGSQYYFLKLDSSGNKLFERNLVLKNIPAGTASSRSGVSFDSSGNLYISCNTTNTYTGVTVSKLSASDGTIVWTTYISGFTTNPVTGASEDGFPPAIDSSGNVYVAGGNYTRSFLVKLNSSGAIQACKVFNQSPGFVASGPVVTANGSVAIGFETSSSIGSVVYLNSSLTVQWARSMTGYGLGFVTLGPNNGVFVTSRQGNVNFGIGNMLFSVSSSGDVNWVSAFDNPNYGSGNELIPVGDGGTNLTMFPKPTFAPINGYGPQYFALRIQSDGSQLYSYFIDTANIQSTITMGAIPYSLTNTTASWSTSDCTYTTASQTAASYPTTDYTVASETLTLTTTNLDTVTGGQNSYNVAGTYSWVAPAGVTSVSVVCVGGGGGGSNVAYGSGGAGGGLGYRNNYSVTAGSSYTVVVGGGGLAAAQSTAGAGNPSYFVNTSTVAGGGGAPGPYGAGGYYQPLGGAGGGTNGPYGGGGGAGGYAGSGGAGGGNYGTGAAGNGGAAGGGSGSQSGVNFYYSGAGGGVGLLGQGNSGSGGTQATFANQGGSGGGGITTRGSGYIGIYGGGGYGGFVYDFNDGVTILYYPGSAGAPGAVRIIWPGSTRTFPSTNTRTP